jgi:hypothetical protein
MNPQIEAAKAFGLAQSGMGRSTWNGGGSTLPNTRAIRKWLREVIETHDIDNILDAPCGDHRWMADVQFSGYYVGVDCWEDNIERARGRRPSGDFYVADIMVESVFGFGLIICRDFLVHLSLDNGVKVLDQFRKSSSKLLAITHFPDVTNADIAGDWGWRPLNMEAPPFNLTNLLDMCHEDEGQGKTLSLFRLNGGVP